MIDRALELLRLLAERPDAGARVPDIAAALGIHRVSAHRMLKGLVDLGYVEQGEDRRYYIGLEAWYLGAAAANRFRLAPRILEAMDRAAEETGDVVFLMRRTRNEAVCVARREGSFPVRSLVMDVGARRPLGVGATSLAILAALDTADAEAVIAANSTAYPRFGRLDAAIVTRGVAEARERGYALSAGLVIPEVFAVGVPVRASSAGAVIAGLSVATIASRLRAARQPDIAAILARESLVIGEALRGGRTPGDAAERPRAPARRR